MKKTVKTIELIWEERTTASGNRSHSSVVVQEIPLSDDEKGSAYRDECALDGVVERERPMNGDIKGKPE